MLGVFFTFYGHIKVVKEASGHEKPISNLAEVTGLIRFFSAKLRKPFPHCKSAEDSEGSRKSDSCVPTKPRSSATVFPFNFPAMRVVIWSKTRSTHAMIADLIRFESSAASLSG